MKLKWTTEQSLNLTKILTVACLVLAGAALFCIPVITEWYDAVSGQPPIRMLLTVCLYISDMLAMLALWELFQMLRNIAAERVFVPENARCFRIISWCCFAVGAVWLVLTFWRLLAFFVAFIAVFAGLILRVIKNLIDRATVLREENDFTI